MESASCALSTPKRKKFCKLDVSPPLPIIRNSQGIVRVFSACFNGFSVIVEDEEDILALINRGYFGKANLSRSYPRLKQKKPEILRKRVFENRKRWEDLGRERGNSCKTIDKVIVVPDSDLEQTTEDYMTDLKPQFEIDRSGIREKLFLTLEEAFFLCHPLKCLKIQKNSKTLGVEELWQTFQATDGYFLTNYVAYHFFRAKNWVVKSGTKFGGDFLLYKQGPPFYHASYMVIINIVDENLEIISDLQRRAMDIVSLTALNRLCETTGKELLICEMMWPTELLPPKQFSFEDIQKVKIRQILMKRWLSAEVSAK